MAKTQQGWLAAPNVRWVWALVAALVWSVALIFAYRLELGAYLESRIARPLDFRVRAAIGREPEISPKLKIFAIDDVTFSKLGSWVLSLEQWTTVFQLLDSVHPRAIIVDAMFSKGDDLSGELSTSVDKLKHLSTPLVAGAFLSPKAIEFREPLKVDRPEYDLAAMLGRKGGPPPAREELPPLVDRSEWNAYGASKLMQTVFRYIGHIIYLGGGTVQPMIQLGDNTAIGHIALYAGKDVKIAGGKLLVDDTVVPMDQAGNLNVNFVDPASFYKISRRMQTVLVQAESGDNTNLASADDVILIIPQMYTGNTDFKQSPVGAIPGGFILASMINSVLTGQWLRPLAGGEALIVLLAFFGAFVGRRCRAVSFWGTVVGTVLGGLVLSEYLFAFHAIVAPWLFPMTAFLGSGITVFAEKTRVGEKKVQALRLALEGSVAPSDLKSLLKRPERVSFEARERVVTLMFIDVVGFSLLAENMLPRMAFENLKKMLATIGDTIHSFGGIIDKTLGDGLLCYFGYRFDEDSSSPDHAEKALLCAIKIQQDNLMRNIEAAENGEPVYPLRIGINTASCYLGDLGHGSRIDFTVVGNGVNFAKRLEGACEMHSVLIGATTNDLVKGIGLQTKAITKRFVRIKHHSELVEAYEYDPFHADPDLRMAALEGFRKCANIERVDQRWPVHDPSKIQLTCDFGSGQLVNFSHTGVSVKLKQLLAKGTRLNLSLDGAGGALKALLAKEGIDILQGEVRWGYPEGAEFVHGIMITNIDDTKSDFLVQYLCEFAFARDGRVEREGLGGKSA